MTLDSGPDREAATAITRADCILAVGYDIAEHDPKSWNPDRDKTIVHIDYEPAEVYEHYNPDVELVADISATLRGLREQLDGGTTPTWCRDLHERIVADVSRKPDPDDSFSVKRVLPYLRAAMADEDVLSSDVGSHKMAIAQHFRTYEPNTCIISNGLASMGIAVPGGIAADLAVDANVVVATGDGGFLMNAAEIETATRLGLGFTIVVFNDNDYGLISQTQIDHTGEQFGTELTNPDFQEFAESFGIDGYRPETWPDVESTPIPSGVAGLYPNDKRKSPTEDGTGDVARNVVAAPLFQRERPRSGGPLGDRREPKHVRGQHEKRGQRDREHGCDEAQQGRETEDPRIGQNLRVDREDGRRGDEDRRQRDDEERQR